MRAKEFITEHGYIGWELQPVDRTRLMEKFPPKYPDVIAHHITHQFGVSSDEPIPDVSRIQVVGYVDDGSSLECLVVAVDGSISRQDGKVYHITWSIDRSKGRKPVHSNDVIMSNKIQSVTPINIAIAPKFFGK